MAINAVPLHSSLFPQPLSGKNHGLFASVLLHSEFLKNIPQNGWDLPFQGIEKERFQFSTSHAVRRVRLDLEEVGVDGLLQGSNKNLNSATAQLNQNGSSKTDSALNSKELLVDLREDIQPMLI
ncbi:hypothetical protein C8J56DRAFT_1026521 [Mycena floridula]|nr:hypothetical protein C8J56DRAFT_1026521 [Mycena floridula]